MCSYSSLGKDASGEEYDGYEAYDDEIDELQTQQLSHMSNDMFNCITSQNDDATALGSAFHRLAQRSIDLSPEGELLAPDQDAVQRQCRIYSLSREQQVRLTRALNLWFTSECAHAFASYPYRYAEVPFMIAFGTDKVQFLEGEIDGLACSFPYEEVLNQPEEARCAFLIDYKTGGSPVESSQEIYQKHLLQAQCYAYALLSQGFRSVRACFVRVEQEDTLNPHEPQIQEYNFDQSHLQYLESTIYQRYLLREKTAGK